MKILQLSILSILCCSLWNTGFSQQLISMSHDIWNNTQSVFENSTREFYTYDTDGVLKIMLRQVYYENSWLNSSNVDYAYVSGKLTEKTEQQWNHQQNGWNPYSRTQYTYSGADTLSSVYQEWLSGVWTNQSRYVHEYDPQNGFKSQRSFEIWEDNQWRNLFRDTFSNNASGQVMQRIRYEWDNNQQQWELDYRCSYTYTSDGKISFVMKEEDDFTLGWIEVERENRTYDNKGLLTTTFTEKQYNQDGLWFNYFKSDFANNPDGTLHQMVFKVWIDDAWQNAFRKTYTYGTAVLGIVEAKMNTAEIFPNPADECVNISFAAETKAKLTVTGLHGKVFQTEDFTGTHAQLSLASLASGVYLLKIESEGKQQVQKIVKR